MRDAIRDEARKLASDEDKNKLALYGVMIDRANAKIEARDRVLEAERDRLWALQKSEFAKERADIEKKIVELNKREIAARETLDRELAVSKNALIAEAKAALDSILLDYACTSRRLGAK